MQIAYRLRKDRSISEFGHSPLRLQVRFKPKLTPSPASIVRKVPTETFQLPLESSQAGAGFSNAQQALFQLERHLLVQSPSYANPDQAKSSIWQWWRSNQPTFNTNRFYRKLYPKLLTASAYVHITQKDFRLIESVLLLLNASLTNGNRLPSEAPPSLFQTDPDVFENLQGDAPSSQQAAQASQLPTVINKILRT